MGKLIFLSKIFSCFMNVIVLQVLQSPSQNISRHEIYFKNPSLIHCFLKDSASFKETITYHSHMLFDQSGSFLYEDCLLNSIHYLIYWFSWYRFRSQCFLNSEIPYVTAVPVASLDHRNHNYRDQGYSHFNWWFSQVHSMKTNR